MAVGGVLLVGAAALLVADCMPGAALRFGILGLVLLVALAVEQWRYEPLTTEHPGTGWLPTDERFVDPESGRMVAVFYKPSTGERRYVAV